MPEPFDISQFQVPDDSFMYDPKRLPIWKQVMGGVLQQMQPGYGPGATGGLMLPRERARRGGSGGLMSLGLKAFRIPGFQYGGFRPYGTPAFVGADDDELAVPVPGGDLMIPMPGSRGMQAGALPLIPQPVAIQPRGIPATPPPMDAPPAPSLAMRGTSDLPPPPSPALPQLPPPAAAPVANGVAPRRPSPWMERYLKLAENPPTPSFVDRVLQAAALTRIGRPAAAFSKFPQRQAEWKAGVQSAQTGMEQEQQALENARRDRETTARIKASEAAAGASGASEARQRRLTEEIGKPEPLKPPRDEQEYWVRLLDDPNRAEAAQKRLNELKKKVDPRAPTLHFITERDEISGDVTSIGLDAVTGEEITRKTYPNIARKRPPQGPRDPAGRWETLTDDQGRIIGYYNPETEEAKPPPPLLGARRTGVPFAAREKLAALNGMAVELPNLQSLGEKYRGILGPISGRAVDLARQAPAPISGALKKLGDPAEINKLYRISDNLKDKLLRARSGAQINEQEFKRLEKLIPDPRTPADKFFSDLTGFQGELNSIIAEISGARVEHDRVSPSQSPLNPPKPEPTRIMMVAPGGVIIDGKPVTPGQAYPIMADKVAEAEARGWRRQ